MNTINLGNNYQNTAFQGYLQTGATKLPSEKLGEVSALYSQLSKKLPDMELREEVVSCGQEVSAEFINFYIDKCASTYFALSEDITKMFEQFSAEKIAEIFVKIAKKMKLEAEMQNLKNQIVRAKGNLAIAEAKPQTKPFKGLVDNFRAKLENLNKEYSKKEAEFNRLKLPDEIMY